MKPFDYLRPASLSEALAALDHSGAAVLAAGTNLLDLMKIGVALPERLVDVTGLPGLDRLDWLPDGGLRIGAMVKNSALTRDPRFVAAYPAVAEALLSGASPQLRNAATVGGNLMQQSRCSYFQDTDAACNRREAGAGCSAIGGATGNHAVLGWTPACIATHPSDFAVPLAALGAVVEVEGPNGRRDIPVTEFHSLPEAASATPTALAPGELVTALHLPAEGFAAHARYLKLRERTSFAFALVSATAMLRMDRDRIAEARLALGGVAARPWRCPGAEAALVGQIPGPDSFAAAARLALEGARPSVDNAHKIELARRVARRALTLAAQGTPAQMPALPGSVFAETGGPAHV